MRRRAIQLLIEAVEANKGQVSLYGSGDDEEHGTCFTLPGIEATFSVHTREGTLPPGKYDIQIEGVPPGEYVYTNVVSLTRFLESIDLFAGPAASWPVDS